MPSLLALLLAASRVINNIIVAYLLDQQHYKRSKTAPLLPDKRTVLNTNTVVARRSDQQQCRFPPSESFNKTALLPPNKQTARTVVARFAWPID